MTHVTYRLTAKNPDQLRNPTLGNRVWATFTLFKEQFILHWQVRLNDPPEAARAAASCHNYYSDLLLCKKINSQL